MNNISFKVNSDTLVKLILLVIAFAILDRKPKPATYFQPVVSKIPIKRKDFSEKTKKFVLFRQRNLCNSCLKPLQNLQDFHHRNGNRADNRYNNCEVLCPNCHAKKTRRP